MRDKFNAMKAQWENEKSAIGKVQKLREQIEAAQRARSKRAEQSDTTSKRRRELKYGRLPELQKAAGRGRESAARRTQKQRSCCATRSPRRRSPGSSSAGPASRSPSSMEGEREKLLHLDEYAAQARHRAGRGRRRGVGGHPALAAPAFRTRTARSARSCSSARRASARPSWPRRWPRRSLTTRRTWSASICPNIWRSSPCRA